MTYERVRRVAEVTTRREDVYASASNDPWLGWIASHDDSLSYRSFLFGPCVHFVRCVHSSRKAQHFLTTALFVMVIGISSMYLAFEAGQAAADLVHRTGEVRTIIEHHRKLADLARSAFTAATVLFGLTLLMRMALHLRMRELIVLLPLGCVVFYGLGLFWLIHTAYNGERPVHEFGVRSVVSP